MEQYTKDEQIFEEYGKSIWKMTPKEMEENGLLQLWLHWVTLNEKLDEED